MLSVRATITLGSASSVGSTAGSSTRVPSRARTVQATSPRSAHTGTNSISTHGKRPSRHERGTTFAATTKVSEVAPSNLAEQQPESEESSSVWFFGYGATMNSNVIANRQLNPLDSMPAMLSNYRLVFDIGEMSDGSAFASVRAAEGEGAEVHGVLYRFTQEDYDAMLRSENAVPPKDGLLAHDTRTYCAHPVKVRPYGAAETVKAYTLVNRRTQEAEAALAWGHGGSDLHNLPEEKSPSWRYLAVLCEGARAYGLEEEYVDALAQLEFVRRGAGGPPPAAAAAEGSGAEPEAPPDGAAPRLTLAEVERFDGRPAQNVTARRVGQSMQVGRPPEPVYVACGGRVFDVSQSRAVYRTGFLKGWAGKDVTSFMAGKLAYVPSVDVDGTALEVGEDGLNDMQRETRDSIMAMIAARNPLVGTLQDDDDSTK